MSNDKDSQLIWENYFKEKQHGAHDDDEEDVEKVDEELDHGDEAGDYINFLKTIAQQSGDGSDVDAMENVLSHPFEETYAEYLRTKSASGVYTAAKAHMKLAEQMGVYHEVDIQALGNWKYS